MGQIDAIKELNERAAKAVVHYWPCTVLQEAFINGRYAQCRLPLDRP
jgi:hypothetical protein